MDEAQRHLADLERSRSERLASLDRLQIARTGPVLPPQGDAAAQLAPLVRELLELQVPSPEYGPRLAPTGAAEKLRDRYPKTLEMFYNHIAFLAQELGDKSVAELERLATALYVTREQADRCVSSRAQRLHDLKPHITVESARCYCCLSQC